MTILLMGLGIIIENMRDIVPNEINSWSYNRRCPNSFWIKILFMGSSILINKKLINNGGDIIN